MDKLQQELDGYVNNYVEFLNKQGEDVTREDVYYMLMTYLEDLEENYIGDF